MNDDQMQDEKPPLPNPPPGGEGTNEKNARQFLVAYHAGPPSIGFFGRQWQRDVAQPVTAAEWKAMQARGDFDEFNFTKEK